MPSNQHANNRPDGVHDSAGFRGQHAIVVEDVCEAHTQVLVLREAVHELFCGQVAVLEEGQQLVQLGDVACLDQETAKPAGENQQAKSKREMENRVSRNTLSQDARG